MPDLDIPEGGSQNKLNAKPYGTCSGKTDCIKLGKMQLCSTLARGAQILPDANSALCTYCTNWERAHDAAYGVLDYHLVQISGQTFSYMYPVNSVPGHDQ